MSKGFSYHYSGTKGHIIGVARSLPNNPRQLLKSGWKDVSDPRQAMYGSHTYQEEKTGLKVRFDEKSKDANGYKGKDHYHVYNPDATSNSDLYLDINGNPVRKNSRPSHILPEEG